MSRLFSCWFGCLLAALPCGSMVAEETTGVDFFEAKIRPVLVQHCYGCHSEDARSRNDLQGNLLLDTRAGLLQGGDLGSVLDLDDPGKSTLVQALRYQDLKMPPAGKLPAQIAADFERWIRQGAADPRTVKTPAVVAAKPSDEEPLWSLQPLQRPVPPTPRDRAWPDSPLDQFIAAERERHGLTPVGDAEPQQLVRRLYFDLIGLPPTPAEAEAFVADYQKHGPAAMGPTVDRLLASPRFGERWGRHWLDLVRFAETNGGDRNVIWPHAWRYRDYVIDAFNVDKPFDQFVREQIAGDLLPVPSDPDLRDQQLIATGMLTLGPKLFMETDAERFKIDRVDEQIDVVSRGILGLTISCARCHDHKFDPISTADYYRLAGVFGSTHLLYGEAAPAGNQYGHDRDLQPIGPDGDKLHGPAQVWKQQVAEQTNVRNKARSSRYGVTRNRTAQENKLKQLTEGKTPEQQMASDAIQELQAMIATLTAEVEEWDEKIRLLDEKLKQTTENPPPLPDYAMAVRDADEPADYRIHLRGDGKQLGDQVGRGTPVSVPPAAGAIAPQQSGRLQLAAWMTDRGNPLTSRVAVNRIWGHLFGVALAPSVNNFGRMGDPPSHPALLDYLAVEFQEQGWSTKGLIRQIVTSRTYRLASTPHDANLIADPENRWLWRMRRRRLEAEPLRDALLLVGGSLQTGHPAASVLAVEFAGNRELNSTVVMTTAQQEGPQRAVYLPIARMSLPVSLKTWNFPDPSLLAGVRSDRPVADQQLYFLNSPLVIRQASLLAGRLLAEHGDPQARLDAAWRMLFARGPSMNESRLALDYLAAVQAASADSTASATEPSAPSTSPGEQAAWAGLCQALLASVEFRYLD
ncbi:PSD1 and planctomycete cytochrome C domain-containing protein [Lignipirellula cremea]|nr:PSD1 and planctomycete cytochrome C domain-containing protein [Lignipirellula cremea]